MSRAQEIVADCSVTLALHLPDERGMLSLEESRLLWQADMFTPFVWPLEVAHSLRKCILQKRLTLKQAAHVAGGIEQMEVEVIDNSGPFRRWMDLAVANNLTAYDSTYIDLALATRRPLATLDARLAGVAGRLGITNVLSHPR